MNTSDRFAVRAVVVVLGAVVLAVTVGEIVLAFVSTPIPDSIDRLGFAALGAISGLLSRTTSPTAAGDPPVRVVVDQAFAAPVPTAEVSPSTIPGTVPDGPAGPPAS